MTEKNQLEKNKEKNQIEEMNFSEIEDKWQERWEKEKVFEIAENSKKPKYYVLEMFPYPSASGLHMGHALNYTIGDVFARFKRMKGFNVLYPIGFDAMGLPAENAAIKAGEHPRPFTERAIKNYSRQMKEIGLSYAWSKKIATLSPEYIKWNQHFFLKFFEENLIYQKKAPVNWCPECKTVLANEQVQGGKCWRHEETDVEIRHLNQWYLNTTKYAEELLNKLPELDWPKKIKAMQKNWIGKSHGTEIDFNVKNPDKNQEKKFPIFTTRPDTIYGVTFMVISAQHSELMDFVTEEQKPSVESFLEKIKTVSEKEIENLEKEGVFTGSYATNPLTNEKIPVYAGNFVVADYGSGMVMAVPAHDQRDFEFAKKYNISIKVVISPEEHEINPDKMNRAFTSQGVLVNSGEFNGWSNNDAISEITKKIEKMGKGKKAVNYKLRDWGFSRQRYWGTPIPVVRCKSCGLVPVPEKDLPVLLPEKVEFGKGNPLETNEEWIKVKCPKCNKTARRETETIDTFFDSSWYFLRYPDNKNVEKPFEKEIINNWLPVNKYIGGAEHACLHLIYARFFTKALRDLGYLDFDEPFTSLFNQGMLHGSNGEKMSKSKGNIINPDDVSKEYGMDTARFFLLSLASPEKDRDWSDTEIKGTLKLMNKIFNLYLNSKISEDSEEILEKLNTSIIKVTESIETFQFRDGLIHLRELFESMAKSKISKQTLETALKLLSPFCPHIAEELWEKLGNNEDGKNFISLAEWPKTDESKLKKNKKINQNLDEKIISQLKKVTEKYPDKKNVYLYLIPPERNKIDEEKIKKEIKKEVKVFATNESEVKSGKADPEGKSKNAKPGKPGIYLE